LADLQTDEGGLRYKPGSSDINTWSTVFCVQAVRAGDGSLKPREVI
jgi:hypothetical protein